MDKFQMFLEQVKFLSILKAISGEGSNLQTLHHAFQVDPNCIENSSGKILGQAADFVELMLSRGNNKSIDDPAWLVYK